MKTDLFQSCGHCWIFQICWHIECSTFTASSFRIWNSSTGIPSPPLALFLQILQIKNLKNDKMLLIRLDYKKKKKSLFFFLLAFFYSHCEGSWPPYVSLPTEWPTKKVLQSTVIKGLNSYNPHEWAWSRTSLSWDHSLGPHLAYNLVGEAKLQ